MKAVTELKEMLEKQSHKGPQEVTCHPSPQSIMKKLNLSSATHSESKYKEKEERQNKTKKKKKKSLYKSHVHTPMAILGIH